MQKKFISYILLLLLSISFNIPTYANTIYADDITAIHDRTLSGATRNDQLQKVHIEYSSVKYNRSGSLYDELHSKMLITVNPYQINPDNSSYDVTQYTVNGANATLYAIFPPNSNLTTEQKKQLVNQTLEQEGYYYQVA